MKRIAILISCLLLMDILCGQSVILQWSNSLGGSMDESPGNVTQDSSRTGYYIIGYEASNDGDVSLHMGIAGSQNLWLVKTDNIGNKLWDKSFGGTQFEKGLKVFQSKNSGFVLIGSASSLDGDVVGVHPYQNSAAGSYDYWIVQLDSSLNIQWQRCLGGTEDDNLKDAILTSDGGYLLLGDIQSGDGNVSGYHGNDDYWAVKLDSIGNLIWQKCLGSAAFDAGVSCTELPDSSYLLVGYSQTPFTGYHSGSDIAVVKLSKTGAILSQRSYGGSNIDEPCKILSGHSGEFYVIGTTGSSDGDVTNFMGYYDIWIFKADHNGDIIWQKCYGGSGIDFSYGAALSSDGGLVFTGMSNSNDSLYVIGTHGQQDAWVAKIDSSGILQWGKSLGGSVNDKGISILEIDPTRYILSAETNSSDGDINFNHGGHDIWIAELTDNGSSINENDNYNFFNVTFNSNLVNINFFETKNKFFEFSICDIVGRKILEKKIEAHEGLNQIAFPFNNFQGIKIVNLGQFRKVFY